MLKELLDIIGGLPALAKGMVEGIVFTAFLTAVYFAFCAIA